MIRIAFFYLLLLSACVYAVRRGGAPERLVAVGLLVGTAASWAMTIGLKGTNADSFISFETGVFLVDAVLLLWLLAIAMFANRYWPLWLTALQAFPVAGHLAKAIAPEILPNVYQVTQAFTAYPGLILLIAATRLHVRRRAEKGHDPSWSASSLASIRRWRTAGPTG